MAYKPKDTRERIIHRLKIARGQLDAIIKMVEGDKYCMDIIHQSQAVQGALRETDNILLENHLTNLCERCFRKWRTKKAKVELMKIFRKN